MANNGNRVIPSVPVTLSEVYEVVDPVMESWSDGTAGPEDVVSRGVTGDGKLLVSSSMDVSVDRLGFLRGSLGGITPSVVGTAAAVVVGGVNAGADVFLDARLEVLESWELSDRCEACRDV